MQSFYLKSMIRRSQLLIPNQKRRLEQISEYKEQYEIYTSINKINEFNEYKLVVVACNTHYHDDILIKLFPKVSRKDFGRKTIDC